MVGWVSGVACLTGLVTGMGFSNTAATAQEGGCLMITSSGKRINLTKLCGVPSGVTQSGQPGVHVARIKRREGGTPVIDVVFNGSRSFEMLLDTGASGTLITESMAIALRIPIVTTGRFTVADGRTVVFPIGQVRSMSIDGAESRNVLVAIAPNTATGLLGQNFFGQYDIKIKRDVIEFYRR
jgi:aspartyl protease family protein